MPRRIGNPLYEAVVAKNLARVGQLLAGGSDANGEDPSGERPLHAAARWGQAEAARLLLEAGADVDATDDHGNTPLSTAVYEYRDENHEPYVRVLDVLLEHDADPNKKNRHGVSPRSLAATIGNTNIEQVFKEAIARTRGPALSKKASKKASRK
jgi:ankyrin repeat protein